MNRKIACGILIVVAAVWYGMVPSKCIFAAEPPASQSQARPVGAITTAAVVTDEQYQCLTEKCRQITASVRKKRIDGTTVYTPGGDYIHLFPRDCYYLVHGAQQFVPAEDIREILRLIFRHQGPEGIVPQCIAPDEGDGYAGGLPVGDSAQFVVLLAYEYFQRTSDRAFVKENIVRLKRAMDSMPRSDLGLIWIDPEAAVVAYGFTDTVIKTGDELFCSLLYWETSRQLAEMAKAVGEDVMAEDFLARAALVEKNLASLWDEESGMYMAASLDCRQIDIWGNAYLVYIGFPDLPKRQRICRFLVEHYPQIVYAGQVRHLQDGQYWQKTGRMDQGKPCPPDEYQNGAYWGTATGWVAYAIAQVDPALASKMLGDMTDYYSRFDAYECVCKNGNQKFPGYAASIGNPLAAIRRLRTEGGSHVE